MAKDLGIPFVKFHGLGNDFILVAGTDLFQIFHRLSDTEPVAKGAETGTSLEVASFARSICDRHTGVGADGVLLILAPKNRKHDARMLFFNADGSEAEMSGNGIRCAAAFILENARHQLAFEPPGAAVDRALGLMKLQIETAAGVKSVEMLGARKGTWIFRVGMGEPVLAAEKIPFKAGDFPSPIIEFPLRTQQGVLPVSVTSMGNPHCSVFVEGLDAMDWPLLGQEIENNALFPKRTNVEFVKVISRGEIEVRFWERGVGQTTSSGTGSCAAVVACILNGLTDRKVRVRTLAGILDVAWAKKGEVKLTGPVELIARGAYFYRR